ncbi:hypothetical protein PR202_ga28139 [Eleusine coracana subsp. coracana]|uniref:Disease resistance protein At4g27190-like leucine-rich repeats domain-containing protein n=1 Tax=Eleusine coracana subsp. coracana TaxID=191504 RepID=A0AAV5DIP0_ELECO|nr:hypothetical protein PR202_ga28139 [Eleusine coracana subsp. coracana]
MVRILDISGTQVKTLDLTTTTIVELDELYLLDCEKLCAIMWPPEDKRRQNMHKLHINTIQASSGATRSSPLPALLPGSQVDSKFDWYISQTPPASIYGGIEVDHPQQANDKGDGDATEITWMWPSEVTQSCYMYIQDQKGTSGQAGTITSGAESKGAPSWTVSLLLLGIEVNVYKLRIFWASQLPKARYIWQWSEHPVVERAFPNLASLHLDCCPKIIYILPISMSMLRLQCQYGFRCLKNLEIMWCGDLKEVVPLDIEAKRWRTLDFPELKRIHLHELPMLHSICDCDGSIYAPKLETLKIRGCWSLKRLPTTKKVVQCDCEKEWWDSLEWEYGSQKKLYMPIHSKYYKKATLPRGSVLR